MKQFFKKYFTLILIFLVVAFAGAAVYFYRQATHTAEQSKASTKEAQSLAKQVGRIMMLPTDETPTIATVSDPEALRGQIFFADAKVGDKVLIYSNAKKAILFDPKAHKIINIAPLNTDVVNKTETQPTGEENGSKNQ